MSVIKCEGVKIDGCVFFWHGSLQGSQQSKLTHGETDGDDKKDVSYDQTHESSHQARVAQSLQAHDYVSISLHSSDHIFY